MAEKRCTQCGLTLPLTRFSSNGDRKNGSHRVSPSCKTCRAKYISAWGRRIKDAVIKKYGGKCACCGEKERKFLTIDHKNNDGYKERKHKKISGHPGWHHYEYSNMKAFSKMYRSESLLPEFQILCLNCNMGKHLNGGVCPHKQKEK